MSNPITNSTLRSDAKQLVKQNLGRIILMNLAKSAASSLLAIILLALFAGRLPSIITSIDQLSRSRYLDAADVVGVVLPMLGMLILPIVGSAVLSSVLNLGYLNGLIQMSRDATVKASVVLSRVRHVLASLGLPLWTGLKTSLWSLPGYLVTLFGSLILSSATMSSAYRYSSGFSAAKLFVVVGVVVIAAGMILSIALTLAASYRYAMATYILADDPIVGVYDAVEKSKAMMLGRKFQLFRLGFFYVLLGLLVMIGGALLILLGGLLSEVIGIFSSLILLAALALMTVALVLLSLQQQMAFACFYESHRILRR